MHKLDVIYWRHTPKENLINIRKYKLKLIEMTNFDNGPYDKLAMALNGISILIDDLEKKFRSNDPESKNFCLLIAYFCKKYALNIIDDRWNTSSMNITVPHISFDKLPYRTVYLLTIERLEQMAQSLNREDEVREMIEGYEIFDVFESHIPEKHYDHLFDKYYESYEGW